MSKPQQRLDECQCPHAGTLTSTNVQGPDTLNVRQRAMSDGHGSRTHLPLHTTLIQVSEETGRKGREREGGEMGERGRGGGAWKGGGGETGGSALGLAGR